eukprot:364559-Chlamydomonas_euryale.AAC.1
MLCVPEGEGGREVGEERLQGSALEASYLPAWSYLVSSPSKQKTSKHMRSPAHRPLNLLARAADTILGLHHPRPQSDTRPHLIHVHSLTRAHT